MGDAINDLTGRIKCSSKVKASSRKKKKKKKNTSTNEANLANG